MKKIISLAVFILLLYACTVQKKQYYIFDRYVIHPKKDTTFITPGKGATPEPIGIQENRNLTSRLEKPPEESADDSRGPANIRILKQSRSATKKINSIGETDEAEPAVRLSPRDISKSESTQNTKQRKNGNGILYLATALMGLAVLTIIRVARPVATKITRWAKANPKKTQGLIAGIQLPLLGLGVMNGYNLDQLGYEISDTSTYLFGTLMTIGFLTVPFIRPKEEVITIPKKVNRHRLSYLSVTLASLMLSAGVGNNLSDTQYDSRVINAVSSIDQSIFSDNYETDKSNAFNSSDETVKKNRRTAATISGVAAFFLILLLVVTTCAGVCLTIAGFSGAFSAGNAFAVLGGLLIAALSILGIIKVSKASKKSKNPVSK